MTATNGASTTRTQAMIDHWANIAAAAHDKIRDAIGADKTARLADTLERFEADLAPLLTPIVADVVANPDTPGEIRDLLAPLATPTNFTQSILIGIALGGVLSPVLGTALAPLTQDLANVVWAGRPVRPLTAEQLAVAVLKGVVTEADGATAAKVVGYSADNFGALVDIAGQAIGIEQAILLWRRGDIADAELERIVHYSNVRSDFLPDIKALRYVPVSAGEVIAGVLKNHLTPTDAQARLNDAGIDPTNLDWLVATAGRPYGTQEALSLLNRGVIDENRVRQVVAQSDINPDFTDDILALRVYLPPPRSIVPMLRAGAITEARARQLLDAYGTPADIADAFIAEANSSTTANARALSQAQVLRFYGAGLILRAEAQTRLEALKYDATTITLLLDYEDNAVRERYINAVVTRVHARYVSYKITSAEALTAMQADGITNTAAAALMQVWDIERSINTHSLTPASVVGAYRRGQIGAAECKARLLALGVDPDDLAIVVADGFPPTKPAPAEVQAVLNA